MWLVSVCVSQVTDRQQDVQYEKALAFLVALVWVHFAVVCHTFIVVVTVERPCRQQSIHSEILVSQITGFFTLFFQRISGNDLFRKRKAKKKKAHFEPQRTLQRCHYLIYLLAAV